MITITTNVSKRLSPAHRKEIEIIAANLFGKGEVSEVNDYNESSKEADSEIKFYLGGVPIKEIIEVQEKWSDFGDLLKKILIFSQEDCESNRELEFWVSSTKAPFQINIFFSASNAEEISNKLLLLKDTLVISKVFDQSSAEIGKVLIVGYDTDNNVWRVNYV